MYRQLYAFVSLWMLLRPSKRWICLLKAAPCHWTILPPIVSPPHPVFSPRSFFSDSLPGLRSRDFFVFMNFYKVFFSLWNIFIIPDHSPLARRARFISKNIVSFFICLFCSIDPSCSQQFKLPFSGDLRVRPKAAERISVFESILRTLDSTHKDFIRTP